MPEVSRFYGIVIRMFFKPREHEPAHIHATYGEYAGVFDIRTCQMLDGNMPQKAQEMVQTWIGLYEHELQEMWDTQKISSLPPL